MEMDDNKRYHCKIKKKKGSIYFLSLSPPPSLLFLSFVFHHLGLDSWNQLYIYPRWNYIINFCQKS